MAGSPFHKDDEPAAISDVNVVPLADVYLMCAEAKLRKNNDAAAALADVNTVRASRTASTPAPALTSMNLDLLFCELAPALHYVRI